MIDLAPYEDAIADARSRVELLAILDVLREDLEGDYEAWARYLFPDHLSFGFAPHHHELWQWGWAIEADKRQEPFAAIWPRGGAKSMTAEILCAALGARRKRRYGLYVSGKQEQADDHVANIATLLESEHFGELYPEFGKPAVGKFGDSKAWRRNRLQTAGGFTVDAVGLDTAMRGVRINADRPDLIVLDDVDDATDSPKVTLRKVERLTRSLLPTGAEHYTILAVQNLVIPNGIFARIAGVAENAEKGLLASAHVSGPIPAIEGLELKQVPESDGSLRWRVTAGKPTWVGQSIERCEHQIADWTKTSFLIEAQHEVHRRSGGIFRAWDWMEAKRVPGPFAPDDPLVRRVRVWDTAATEPTGDNDPDWTAGVLMAVHLERKSYRVEHVLRFRHASGSVRRLVREQAVRDANLFGLHGIWFGVEEEPGPHGRDRAYEWVHDTLAGFNVRRIPAMTSKLIRAEGWAGAMENQLVEIIEKSALELVPDANPAGQIDWQNAFIAEHEAFPTGDHDDQVDSAAHGFNWVQRYLIEGDATTSAATTSVMRPLNR